MPSTDAVVLGGIPLDNYEHPETYHTLVTKHLPHDATGADLDNAIAKLVFGYAEEIRAPYGSFSCGGGTCADGKLWESFTVPDSFLGGLRESLAGHKRTI